MGQSAELRQYTHFGMKKNIWPVFHSINGDIAELTRIKIKDNELYEEIDYYQYKLGVFKSKYHLFYLQIGIDLWCICLNEIFPMEDITKATKNLTWRILWYHKDQLKK